MTTFAAILAAGRGTRFGTDKTEAILGHKPVWQWSLDTYLNHPLIDEVILVTSPEKLIELTNRLSSKVRVIAGGESRQQSSKNAVIAAEGADIVLIHDAARPFVSTDLITRTIEAVSKTGAAAVATKMVDTIKEIGLNSVRTLDRTCLVAMQTPQAAIRELLLRAHLATDTELTDEMALVEAIGVNPEIVEGDPINFKITTPEDLVRARSMLGYPETRTGIGYDIHSFSSDPDRKLFLGGIHFANHRGLEGHSDADVLIHAACDALLGAASLGDIGQHFPNTDPKWAGCPSSVFLTHAASLLAESGWKIVNLDMTLIGESPKVMVQADNICATVAQALGIDRRRVSVKATTNEKLGSIGRSEGIASFAVASIVELR